MAAVSVNHYENFPVASVLCPSALRPSVTAIYRFARTADDLADEGDASPSSRLADLHAFGADLDAAAAGREGSGRWASVFTPLADVIRDKHLPLPLLRDLLSAFEQDLTRATYADRADLLDYCRRSADPVGRLMLHLYGVGDATSLARSDMICTALQLANFWQDVAVDVTRGRLYLPLSDCAAHALAPDDVLAGQDSPALRATVAGLVRWTREMMNTGAALVHRVPGRAGWELRLVVQGGLRILEKIERRGFDVLAHRPTIGLADAPRLLARAVAMTPPPAHAKVAR
ncbi:MAG: Squalene synthase HpnC [Rhizobacter sp.]|nr:Squalene synthase HpnC [Rhizobacter sp.]